METVTPTPAAVRAAKAIESNHVWGRMEEQRATDRARIIDRETNLPELLAACKSALEALRGEGFNAECNTVQQLEKAIRNAEKS